MILAGGSLIFSAPGAFAAMVIALAVALVVAITVHEFSHTLVAYRLGDNTAVRLGRLSLNPRAHLDPLGTIMLVVVGFGWGKPVPVNPYMLRGGRHGMALVSVAGPTSNLLMAAAFALPFQLGLLSVPSVWPPSGMDVALLPSYIAIMGVLLNVLLAVFNLLPISPLDGSGLLMGIAPRSWLPALSRLQVAGPGLLMAVIMMDFAFGFGLLSRVVSPLVGWVTRVLLS
jgi:Zn-dependent protease